MDEQLVRLSREWLMKALHDLRSAYIVSRDPEGPLDTAVYHCQQAAEKALKSWLTWKSIPFEKTHDLAQLANQAATSDPVFSHIFQAAQYLTPYASIFQYPGLAEEPMPAHDEFDEAIQYAQAIFDLVKGLLPADLSAE
jgi:HEPN domain-containing protein